MTPLSLRRFRDAPWLWFAAILFLGYLVYRPGLAGGFLFDDFVNLNALGATGRVDNAPAFWRYITSGTADPFGRPLALLSFLADARAWPADPAPFLRTNVLLHLLNGALLFVLLRALGTRMRLSPAHAGFAAVIGAALWMLHPLFVSTTLYVVQRQAMLPATFTLLGLIAWVHGTARLATSTRAGVAWMCAAILVCTPLAIASKANGLLLPLFAWVLDGVLLRGSIPDAVAPLHRRLRRWLLIAPTMVVFVYLALHAMHPFDPVADRPWTIGERALTQSRVLIDYLASLVVPRVLTTGLYNDAYVVSRGLLSPPSTLAALLAVTAMVGGAFAMRRRFPAVAAALLFFFAGHVMESTVLPLELYFEHRNYLPAMLLGWPIGLAIVRMPASPAIKGAIAAALIAMLAAITFQRTSLWAQQDRMAWLWAARNPESPRAQATAAIFETRAGRPELAIARLERRAQARPGDLQLTLNLASARCGAGGLSPADVEAVAHALRTATEGDQLVHRWLGQALGLVQTGRCRGLDLVVIERWLAAARDNPRLQAMPGRQQDLDSLTGQVAIARKDGATALAAFDRALAASPTAQVAAKQAAMLATAGCHAEALHHLDGFARLPVPAHVKDTSWSMSRVHAELMARQDFWPTQLRGLRDEIARDLKQHGNTRCMQ